MSPLGKGLLASALTLPLVAFVAGVLAAPAPVDPDRSRPVIIGRVSDDAPPERPSPSPTQAPEERRGGDDPEDRDGRGDDDRGDDDGRTDDSPGSVVIPQPRSVDGDDDDRDDDGDDDDRDDTDDGAGESDDD